MASYNTDQLELVYQPPGEYGFNKSRKRKPREARKAGQVTGIEGLLDTPFESVMKMIQLGGREGGRGRRSHAVKAEVEAEGWAGKICDL